MIESKHVRIPSDLLDRAESLVEPIKARTLGAARWSTTAIVRMALEWGLGYAEQTIAAGGELAPPVFPPAKETGGSGS